MYLGRIERLLTQFAPMPVCTVNMQGKVTRANSRIADVFKYDRIVDMDFFQLTGAKINDLIDAATYEKPIFIERNDRHFKLVCTVLGAGENASVAVFFQESTAYEKLKKLYNDETVCLALIQVDNYDELVAKGDEIGERSVATKADRLIRDWALELEGAIARYRTNLYELVMANVNYERLIESKFEILDKAREIETPTDFPVTLSIGIGRGGKTLAEMDNYAQDALDLAIGRGGDQAVVKNISNFEYFGGKNESVEKSNKGKSRIIAHALRTLMNQSSGIFIMGHKNPDMDSFGAALGVNRIAAASGNRSYIILNEYNETMTDMVADAKACDEYEFITSEKALEIADENAMVVVVDTHRPSLLECRELVDRVDRLAVIDHHRKAEDFLPEQTLSYMEPYASSASELVTELLQYICDKKQITKIEADTLLAGIMLDTNRFAVKAGVRTFEAASWLRRAGADLQGVRRYFQANAFTFKARAAGIANAQIMEGGIAMSICEGQNLNSQIINSQVADELLTIKGIEASFVSGRNEYGKTVVSARSLGNINVQAIMEKFGGGGHMNTAGAQVDDSPEEILEKIKAYLSAKH